MKNTLKHQAGFLLICSAIATSTVAQEMESTSGDWSFSGYGAQASIDAKTAYQEGVDDSAWVVGISGDYTQNNWVTSVGIDLVVYDDNQNFSQEVEGTGLGNNGDRSTQSSSANGGVIFAASGYQWLFGEQQNVAVRLQGGFGLMTFSQRSIASCTDCYSEDIDVDGGIFAKAAVLHSGESISFGAYVQQYMGDGINTVFGVTLSGSF